MSSIPKVALIGVSGFGAIHYQELMELHAKNKLRLVAVTIINQDEEAEKVEQLKAIDCEIFDDYQVMLITFRNKLDLCYIPTGINHHKAMTLAALRSGANVFVEKPLCATLEDALAIRKAEAECGKFVAVGYQHIYQDQTLQLKKLLLSGRLGAVKNLKYCSLGIRGKSYFTRNDWAGKLRLDNGDWILDSPYNNAYAHYLNKLLFWAGANLDDSAEIASVQAELYRARDYTESADLGFLRIKSTDGKNVYFITGHAASEGKRKMSIECEKGIVHFDKDCTRIIIDFADGAREVMDNSVDRMLIHKAVLAKLRVEESFICSVNIAMAQTIAVVGAHKSSGVMKIPDEFIETKDDEKKGECTVVKGLSTLCNECYAKNLLPGELGSVPWAVKGAVFSFKNNREKELKS